jgi:hypothetical protein
MTANERDRIDRLIEDVADWKVETVEAIHKAVAGHEIACPMRDDVKWLVSNAKARTAQAAERRRWYKRLSVVAGAVVTCVGLLAALGFRPL